MKLWMHTLLMLFFGGLVIYLFLINIRAIALLCFMLIVFWAVYLDYKKERVKKKKRKR